MAIVFESIGYTGFGITPAECGIVKRGMRGECVKLVQQLLNKYECCKGLKVDGIFGPYTEFMVKAFQMSHGLDVDGIVGPDTWNALYGGSIPKPKPGTVRPPKPVPGIHLSPTISSIKKNLPLILFTSGIIGIALYLMYRKS